MSERFFFEASGLCCVVRRINNRNVKLDFKDNYSCVFETNQEFRSYEEMCMVIRYICNNNLDIIHIPEVLSEYSSCPTLFVESIR
ncbi:MAG: hypothetical protein PUC88_05820 [Clostridia bacterium]|nr:hypothetical protein [Clostridia bacterium]